MTVPDSVAVAHLIYLDGARLCESDRPGPPASVDVEGFGESGQAVLKCADCERKLAAMP